MASSEADIMARSAWPLSTASSPSPDVVAVTLSLWPVIASIFAWYGPITSLEKPDEP